MSPRGRASQCSICPICSCGCGLYFQQTDGEVCGVMSSEHHPLSAGRLCARGWAAHEPGLWGRRLSQPLVRHNGAPGPTTWTHAIAAAAERVRAVLASGRPIGVLGSGRATNEENFLAAGLARAVLGTGHVDSCLRGLYQDLLVPTPHADAVSRGHQLLGDLEACEVVLLIEGDLARTHPQAAYAILKALRRGARLATIGPAQTQLGRLAWKHLVLRPGDEMMFATALGRAAGAAADGGPRDLQDALGAYAAASRAAIVVAPTGGSSAGQRALAQALAALAERSGHFRRSGSMFLPLPVRGNTRGALEMGAAPTCLPGPSALHDDAARRRLAAAWGGTPVPSPGFDAQRMTREVAGLIVVADDPPVSLRSEEAARRELAGLECLVVLDAFVTPTVEAAHVALPIAAPAEAEGTFTNLEGRIQWLRPAGTPPGAARPGWQVLAELGAALGQPQPPDSVDEVLERIRVAVPSYADAPARDRDGDEPWAWVRGGLPDVPQQEVTSPGDVASPAIEPGAGAEFPLRLVPLEAFEWGDDPLVASAPTLRRDHASLRKRFPCGLVELPGSDARALGVREGWQVRIVSRHGQAQIPVRLSEELAPGMVGVPYAFRDRVAPVLDGEPFAAVRVERA